MTMKVYGYDFVKGGKLSFSVRFFFMKCGAELFLNAVNDFTLFERPSKMIKFIEVHKKKYFLRRLKVHII